MSALLATEQQRIDSILNNTAGSIVVAGNPSASANHNTAIEWTWFGQSVVKRYEEFITAESVRQGVDPNWVKSIIYMENSHGYYDAVFFGSQKTIRPMNIDKEKWAGLLPPGGSFTNDYDNIAAGITLIKRLTDRIDQPDLQKVATLYNATARDKVADYGARVDFIAANGIWQSAPNYSDLKYINNASGELRAVEVTYADGSRSVFSKEWPGPDGKIREVGPSTTGQGIYYNNWNVIESKYSATGIFLGGTCYAPGINPKGVFHEASRPRIAFDATGQTTEIFDSAGLFVAGGANSLVSGPITNTTTLMVNTTGIVTNQEVPDATVASNGEGQVAGGNDWSLVLAENTANIDNSYYGGTVSDAGSDGYRPGNNNVSGTANQTVDVSKAAADLMAALASTTSAGGGGGANVWPDIAYAGADLSNIGYNTPLIPADPLVLDLNGDGIQLKSYETSKTYFDIDNDGAGVNGQPTKEHTGWIAANTTAGQSVNTDGIVVHDLNGDGHINGIKETLSEFYNGNSSTGAEAGQKTFTDGFAALKSLDSNADNQFTSADAAWNELRVWVDDDANGISFKDSNANGIQDVGEASELKTFAALGITSINLATTRQSGLVNSGNEVLSSGTFVQSGQINTAQAVRFIANPNGASFTQTVTNGVVGATITTQGNAGSADVNSYVSGNADVNIDEVLNASSLNVANIYAGAGSDALTGNANGNWLAGGAGSDTFDANGGDDVLLIDSEDQQQNVHAGAGSDVIQVVGVGAVIMNLAQAEAEVFIGGTGDDVVIGGGRSTVFVRGGAGEDMIIGGAANDVLSGEDGADLVDGGAGNDLIRGHRGQDQLLGGAGDDIVDGGLEDDNLAGGAGNDVLIGGRGDDALDGGDGIDVAQYSGSFADYRITKVAASGGADVFRVVDTRSGQDGADTITNIEKLSFADVSRVSLTLGSPLPVKDVVSVNAQGQALSRTAPHLISKAQLLANDRDWDGDASQLTITEVLEAKGGTVSLTAQGDVLFTPNAAFTGVMSFKYRIKDAQNNVTEVNVDGQTEVMKAAVYLQTSDIPNDPLAVEQWYLADTNVMPVWGDYTGKGVRIGQFEPGGPFSTGVEVFDYRHPDLQPNADRAWLNEVVTDAGKAVSQNFSNHATMVAGVMVGARNGEGGVGVAYNASLAGHYIQGEGLELSALSQQLTAVLSRYKDYDVVNNSWGATSNFLVTVVPVGTVDSNVLAATQTGRNGLGTAIVMAGGNDRATGANTNYNALTANHAVITVGSINAPGDLGTLQLGSQPFSNPGASILVSAPGSNIGSTSRELVADNGSVFGSAYDSAKGTSFAAPIVSGVVALMLEANPALGYRDIQTILAMTATRVEDPNGTDWTYNTARNWNGGGMHASHDYGFGKVDALAAVRLAETWYDINTAGNLDKKQGSSGALNAAVPDGAGVLSQTLTMPVGLEVESAQVTVDLTHQRWGDLVIKLISPSGTESILVNRPGKAPGSAAGDLGDAGAGTLNFSFNTTHVRGEASGGNWTLQVSDAVTGNTGSLVNWKLDLYGATADANDVYVYTNEFASTTGRTALVDTNEGQDIINASAVSGNSTINLTNGATSTIAGKTLTISGNVESAFGGDGNDVLTGSAGGNALLGGRGNDSLSGGAGRDRLQGGKGDDTMTGGADQDLFVIHKDAGRTDTIVDFTPAEGGEKIVLVGFEGIADYTAVQVAQEGANTRVSLGGGQSVLLLNLAPGQLSEQNFAFVTDGAVLERYIDFVNQALVTGTAGPDSTALPAGAGDLAVFGLGGDDLMEARTEHDFLDGGNGNDVLWGDATTVSVHGQDWLEGGEGADFLGGGPHADWLAGGSGSDTLSGESGNDSLNGATGDDVLFGGDGNDVLFGGAGDDHLNGGPGNDIVTLDGDFGFANGSNFEFLGTRVGGAGADVFKVLSGGGGSGGYSASGAELFGSNLIADFDPAQPGEYIDLTQVAGITKYSDLSFTNAPPGSDSFVHVSAGTGLYLTVRGVTAGQLNASHFKFAAGAPGEVRGTSGVDALVGDAGANLMDGLGGTDSMVGRTGDDTYVVDSASDVVIELPGGGYDTVLASVSYAMSDNVEALTLTGSQGINATGNLQRNFLRGNSGNNTLDGGAGADEMAGGAGNDLYVVDNQLDLVVEAAGGGVDAVESSVSWTLGREVENLTLTGTGNTNATGNELDNQLVGNEGANILDGAGGTDTLSGGQGGDTYYVDSAGDVVVEGVDAGIDSVYASINITLGTNVENAYLFGAAVSISGNGLDNTLVGNGLDNTLTGGAGNDVLDGAAGGDSMTGGAGDDAYFFDNATDSATEASNEGTDTVLASVSVQLGSGLENLLLMGTAALNATGNGAANHLSGNTAANVLAGGAGADTLDGGAGNDSLTGGDGFDLFVFDGSGNDTDTISDFAAGDLISIGTTLSGGTGSAGSGVAVTGKSLQVSSSNGVTTLWIDTNNTAGAEIRIDLAGTFAPNTFVVTALANGTSTISTSAGKSIASTAGDDVLTGTIGDDTLSGLAGNDTLSGSIGNDLLDGGADTDTASYSGATGGVTAYLWNGQVSGADGTDTLTNIENLIGSAFNDRLDGTNGANSLNGGAGADSLYGYAGNDTLIGAAGNDLADGGADTDTASYADATGAITAYLWNSLATGEGTDTLTSIENLIGSAFNDRLDGTNSANSLDGGGGADSLYGYGGNDMLGGGAGNDLLDGGADTDAASYAGATGAVTAYLWNGQVTGDGTDTLVSIENLMGSAFNDRLDGDNSVNSLDGGAGADSLYGYAGNDTLNGGAGNDVLDGSTETDTASFATAASAVTALLWNGQATGDGSDTLTSIENLIGSGFNDRLDGTNTANGLDGGTGADSLYGYGGNDTLTGGAGNDVLDGGADTDTVSYAGATGAITAYLWNGQVTGEGTDTLAGIETLIGSGFNDRLDGDNGANSLFGGAGADSLYGYGGNDTLSGGAGNDVLDGGADTDTASYAGATGSVTAYLWNSQATGADGTDTLTNIENLIGSAFNDRLDGTNTANSLDGGAGADSLYGYGGNDTLMGGSGNDLLEGGADADAFLFDAASGVDLVYNFASSQGDRVHLKSGLNGSGIASAAQALASTTDVGGNATVNLGSGHMITLVGVTTASLSAADFVIF